LTYDSTTSASNPQCGWADILPNSSIVAGVTRYLYYLLEGRVAQCATTRKFWIFFYRRTVEIFQ
jgi:hypothetical protein